MRLGDILTLVSIAAFGLGVPNLAAPAVAAEYWLVGEDPVVQNDKHKTDPADYMDMFKPNAPWLTVASRLTSFQISTQMSLRGTDDQVKTILDGLRSRHIPLTVDIGVLVWSDKCGKSTEGFASPLAVESIAKRIRSLGGQIDYLNMDEPVAWGHAMRGKNRAGFSYCEYSTDDVATTAASRIAVLRRFFPGIKVGQTDTVSSRGPQMVTDILSFADQLERKSGVKLTYVHTDVAWHTDWQPQLAELAAGLHSRGIKVGIICDGGGPTGEAPSDEVWVGQALQHCKTAAADRRIAPDQFVIQSWVARPTRMLPETHPGTLTNEARQAMTLFN